VQGDWNTTVKLASMLPTQRLTRGHPPPGLTSRTRYFGQPHWQLIEHREGQRPLFDLPPE
jgi:hypothetical protein